MVITKHPATTTRWRVPVGAWFPIVLAISAEAASNMLRAYGLGTHLEAFTVRAQGVQVSLSGVVLCVAALVISLAQSRVAWVAFTPSASRGQRVLAGFALPLLLSISIAAMAATILEAQRKKTGGESNDRTSYDIAKSGYAAAKADADRLAGVRSTDEIRASMDKVRVPAWAWKDTKECTADAGNMGPEERKACTPILDLRVEMAKAIEKAKAGAAMQEAEAKLGELNPPAEQTLEESIVSRGWAWIMGLGVVLVATFGSVIFAKVETVAAPAVTATVHRRPTPPASPNSMVLPPPATPRGGMTVDERSEALADLKALLSRRAEVPSQDWLASRWGRSKTWVSLRLREWEDAGEIPSRVSAGRCKTFA